MSEERNWQNVMIEHKTKDDWCREALAEDSIIYCGRLCETILSLEKQLKDTNADISLLKKCRQERRTQIEQLEQQLKDANEVIDFTVSQSGTSTDYNLKAREYQERWE